MDYTELVSVLADKYGIPNRIAQRWVMQESGFNESAVNSRTGATGLTQIMPSTAADPGYGISPLAAEQLMDPEANLEFGMQYLTAMKDKFGNWEDALRAYNAGPGAVDRSRNYEETNNYVASILGVDPIERGGGVVGPEGRYFGGMTSGEVLGLLSGRMGSDDDRKARAAMASMGLISDALDGRGDAEPLDLPSVDIHESEERPYNPLKWFE